MTTKGVFTYGRPSAGEMSADDALLAGSPTDQKETYNPTLEDLADFVARSPELAAKLNALGSLSAGDRELLNRLESQGVHFRGAGPTLPSDPGPEEAYLKTDDSAGDASGVYVTTETAAAAPSRSTDRKSVV